MSRNRLRWLGAGMAAGLLFVGLGLGFKNYWLMVVGLILMGGALASLSMPLPLL